MGRTPGNTIVREALTYLCEHGPTPIGDLADAVGCDRSTLKRYIDALVDGGAVEVRRNGRCKEVVLGGVPQVVQHHGRCDVCGDRNVMVTHFNYHDQENGFRLCEGCRLLERFRLRSTKEVKGR